MKNSVDICALLGKNIRKLRTTRKMTQNEFAEKVGISVVNLSEIENGKDWPRLPFFEKLLASFDIAPFELFIQSDSDMERYKQLVISTIAKDMDALYPTSSKTSVTFSTTHRRKKTDS